MTMHHAAALASLSIPWATEQALQDWITEATEAQLPQLRADSVQRPSASLAVEGARIAVRHHVACQIARARAGLIGGGLRADSDIPKWRAIELENAICDGLGLRADAQGTVQAQSLRADSYWFREAVTARSDVLIRPNEQVEMVRMTIDTRNVPAYAEYVQLEYLEESGEAAPIVPGQRDFPRVDFGLNRSERKMAWYGIASHLDWSRAIYSQAPSAVDEASAKARIAVRAIERLQEKFLINGLAGIDALSLASAPIPVIFSTVDFSTATLGQKTTEMVRILQAIKTNADWAGATPTVGLIDPRLAQNLRGSNNLDAGGTAVGGAQVMQAMGAEGLTRVVEAPTLASQFSSPRGASYARMVVWAPGTAGALRQIVGMTPAPVSTAEYHGTETLWAARWGGLELGDASSVAIIDIKVS